MVYFVHDGVPFVADLNRCGPDLAFDWRKPMKTREYLAIKRRIDDFELAESLTRTKLIQSARAGNVSALNMLYERYNLRLPLVEDALRIQVPKRQAIRS